MKKQSQCRLRFLGVMLVGSLIGCSRTSNEQKAEIPAETNRISDVQKIVVPPAKTNRVEFERVQACEKSNLNLPFDSVVSVKSPVIFKGVYSSANSMSSSLTPNAYDREQYASFRENTFLSARREPVSTFSIDVDTASYSVTRGSIMRHNRLPPPDSVRAEEFINYFSYDYPSPEKKEPFTVNLDLGTCPWNSSNKLLRIGLQAKKMELKELPPNNLVFLVDVSGSMASPDKLPLLKSGLALLAAQLRDEDRVTLVTYAGSAGVYPSVSGRERTKLIEQINQLGAGGCTAGSAGIQTAYEIAAANFLSKGNNRVILATDGDFNVGQTSSESLVRLIEEKRSGGVYLTVLGFGRGNIQDGKMKSLAANGNGNYAYIDSLSEAKKVLMNELGATLFTVAKDVKIQVEFNPGAVGGYRQVGYEFRKLANADFNNDKKDAGEMGAGHSVTVLYELTPPGVFEDGTDDLKYQKNIVRQSSELLTLKLRYKLPDAEKSTLIERPILAKSLEKKEPGEDFMFASAVAELALLLRDSAYKGTASFDAVIERARNSKGPDRDGSRAEFVRVAELAKILAGSRSQSEIPLYSPPGF